MDADETVSVLQSLAGDQVRPPMVDLNLAMQTGRKRLRRRRLAGTAGSAVAVVAVIAAVPVTVHLMPGRAPHGVVAAGSAKAGATTDPTTAATTASAGPTSLSCVEARLPVPQTGQEGLVTGADPSGRFMVGRVYRGGVPTQVAIWDNGKITTFTIPGEDAELVDITSSGVAVGESFLSSTVNTGWIYANGRLSKLAGPDGSIPIAVNEQGTIAGTEQTKDHLTYPIIWHSATSNPIRLPLPPGNTLGGVVRGIDSDGTIVGTVLQPFPPPGGPLSQGVVWRPDGSVDMLPLPTDLVNGVNGLEIHSIRNGVITAAATITTKTGKSLTPVTYDLSTGRYALLPGANIWIGAGNAKGDIAGTGWGNSTPAVYTPTTGVVYLPTLRKNSTPSHLDGSANTISDNGLIIGGQDTDDNDVITAVIWTCH